jgi:hydrogenase/urease accessory protein HupE
MDHPECQPLSDNSAVGLLGRMSYQCGQPDLTFDLKLVYPAGNPALTSLIVYKSLNDEPQQVFSGPEITKVTLGAASDPVEVSKQYLVAGVEHILIGFDHLLFVLCLIIIAGGFKRLVFTVTGFTLAHSVTLSLATLNIVQIRTELVEMLIALSILLLAVEIIKHRRSNGHTSFTWRYPVAVSSVFGLLHGFGFAVVLQDLGLPQSMKLQALLFFNIGVEIGQLLFIFAVVALAFISTKLISSVNSNRQKIVQFGVYLIGSCSAYWFLTRAIVML